MRGYIYALINPSLKGLLKIGKTSRSPEERAKELSASTGVPTPFIVGYSSAVSDCDQAELHLHELLSAQGYRLSDNREFFQANLNQVVRLFIECEDIFKITDANTDEDYLVQYPENANDYISLLLDEADNFIYGDNGEFVDFEQAENKLTSAANLGSADAYYRLGHLYNNSESELHSYKNAISMFNLAYKNGHSPFECFSSLGFIYALNKDKKNATIAFKKLFNEVGLDEVIKAHSLYQSQKEIYASLEGEIEVEEDTFVKNAVREIINGSLVDLDAARLITNEASNKLTFYFIYLTWGDVAPIVSDTIIQLLPIAKSRIKALKLSSDVEELFWSGIRTYYKTLELEEV